MTMARTPALTGRETSLARLGRVEVSKFETPTGARLRLRAVGDEAREAFFDPLELEGLTRARYKPFAPLQAARAAGRAPHPGPLDPSGQGHPPDPVSAPDPVSVPGPARLQRLQNEFALVGVAVARSAAGDALLVRDLNAGLAILLAPAELEALLPARHMDFAPLVDTSDLVALPEPDIDEV